MVHLSDVAAAVAAIVDAYLACECGLVTADCARCRAQRAAIAHTALRQPPHRWGWTMVNPAPTPEAPYLLVCAVCGTRQPTAFPLE